MAYNPSDIFTQPFQEPKAPYLTPPLPTAPNAQPAAPAATPALAAKMLAPSYPAAAPQAQPAAQPKQAGQPDSVDDFMSRVRARESGGNDMAFAPSTKASGRYQFLPGTWAAVAARHPELNLRPEDIWNGDKQDAAMRAISQDYVNVLNKNGLAATPGNMYMLHFLGEGGGPAFLKAMEQNPNISAPAVFTKEAQYNPTIFYNKDGSPRTLGQVYSVMTRSFGGPPMSAGPAAPGAPAPQTAQGVQVAEAAPIVMSDAGGGGGPVTDPKLLDELEGKSAGPVTDPNLLKELEGGGQDLGAEVKKDVRAPLTAAEGAKPEEVPAAQAGPKNWWEVRPPPENLTPEQQAENLRQQNLSVMRAREAEAAQNREQFKEGGKAAVTSLERMIEPEIAERATAEPWTLGKEMGREWEDIKGMGAGLASTATGLGEGLGGSWWNPVAQFLGASPQTAEKIGEAGAELGEASARGSQYLGTVGSPFGQFVGKVMPWGAPSARVFKVGKEAVAPALANAGPIKSTAIGALKTLQAATEGGAYGGIMGAAAPTGKTDEYERYEEKAENAIFSATLSAAIPGALAALTSGGSEAVKAVKFIRSGLGDEAAKAAEELRTGISSETKKALTDQEKTQRVSLIERRASERAAQKAEETATTAKAERERVVQEQAARPTNIRPEDFADKGTSALVKKESDLEQVRREASRYSERVNLDKGAPSIPTNDVKIRFNNRDMTIEQLAKETASDDVEAALAGISKKLSKGKTTINGKEAPAVSIQQMTEILEDLSKQIETASPKAKPQLQEVYKGLRDRMESTWDEMRIAREEYAKASRDLDPFRTGPAGKITDVDPYSGSAKLEVLKRAKLLTENTPEAAQRLKELAKDDDIKDSFRSLINREIYAPGGQAREPTVAQINSVLKSRERALEATGLKSEFEKLRDERAAVEKGVKEAPGRTAAMERDISKLAAQAKQAGEVRGELKRFLNKVEEAKPEEIASLARSMADKLHDMKYLTDAEHKAYVDQIRDVVEKAENQASALSLATKIGINIAIASGYTGAGYYFSHRFSP